MSIQTLKTLLVEYHAGFAVIQLNRQKQLNSLSVAVIDELGDVLADIQANSTMKSVVITGNEKAFAAGADVKDLISKTYKEILEENFILRDAEVVARFRKPIIAAVAGYCLGGGCELALMSDVIIAAENAKFGLPEISLAITPGWGGTQRLPRFIGKAKAMDMILSARTMDAAEAERCGLVSRVVPTNQLLQEAMALAARIAEFSLPAILINKELVNAAFEGGLAQGLNIERRLNQSLFAFEDRVEGMEAFIGKRRPAFRDR